MGEAVSKVIKCLIISVIIVVVVGVIFWTAHFIGFSFPLIVERGVWVIAALCILLFWWQAFKGYISL